MLPHPIDKTVARHLDQERAQLIDVLERPFRLPQPVDHVRPNRLDDVGRIELRPKPARHPPPNHHPQIGFEGAKHLLRRIGIACVQLGQQAICGTEYHVRTEGMYKCVKSQLDGSSSSLPAN